MTSALSGILTGIDWDSNVSAFVADIDTVAAIERGCHIVAVWNHELSFQDAENAALPFLQKMKASLFQAPACFALGLYKPAASSMRASVENALYFSYFHSHYSELKTLIRDENFYISKSKVLEFHNTHTPFFKKRQADIGFIAELDAWYSEISAIVHGQIPGVWTTPSLKNTAYNPQLNKLALREFTRAVLLINYLFIITADEDTWEGFSSSARRLFLKGMSGVKKKALGRAIV